MVDKQKQLEEWISGFLEHLQEKWSGYFWICGQQI